MFKTMGYSPVFLLEIGQFSTLLRESGLLSNINHDYIASDEKEGKRKEKGRKKGQKEGRTGGRAMEGRRNEGRKRLRRKVRNEGQEHPEGKKEGMSGTGGVT